MTTLPTTGRRLGLALIITLTLATTIGFVKVPVNEATRYVAARALTAWLGRDRPEAPAPGAAAEAEATAAVPAEPVPASGDAETDAEPAPAPATGPQPAAAESVPAGAGGNDAGAEEVADASTGDAETDAGAVAADDPAAAPPAEPAAADRAEPAEPVDYAHLHEEIMRMADTLERFNDKLLRLIAQTRAEKSRQQAQGPPAKPLPGETLARDESSP